jgi:hypothetical protein
LVSARSLLALSTCVAALIAMPVPEAMAHPDHQQAHPHAQGSQDHHHHDDQGHSHH